MFVMRLWKILSSKAIKTSILKWTFDELDERMFGGEANAEVSFQIGQLRYVLFHDEYI